MEPGETEDAFIVIHNYAHHQLSLKKFCPLGISVQKGHTCPKCSFILQPVKLCVAQEKGVYQ